MHKLVPRKCVVFGGSDTGRRFYMCSIANVSSSSAKCALVAKCGVLALVIVVCMWTRKCGAIMYYSSGYSSGYYLG